MKRFLVLTFLILPGLFLAAQDYNKSIGIRGGLSSGFEYRFFTDDANSIKFLLGINNEGDDRGFRLHALKEFHHYQLFTFTDQLVFFWGAGIHAGFESWDKVHYRDGTSWYDTRTALVVGLDGLAGLEYVFYEAPISVGLEVKPFIDVLGHEMFRLQPFDFAFTIKYLF